MLRSPCPPARHVESHSTTFGAGDPVRRPLRRPFPGDVTPVIREVTNACVVVPVEIASVIGVTADDVNMARAAFASYGVGVAGVTAILW